jgi:hypothetical protein
MDQLACLAPLRASPGIRVAITDDRAWISWEPGRKDILARLLPRPGVSLYVRRDGRWHRLGRRLPDFNVPESLNYQPLHHVLIPSPCEAVPAGARVADRFLVRLVPDTQVRRTTAMICAVADLKPWVDMAPGPRLAAIFGARLASDVVLVGDRLPLFAGAQRFWGESIWLPLGFRLAPNLPEAVYRQALNLGTEDRLLWRSDKPQIVSAGALHPLSRAGVRLALGGRP